MLNANALSAKIDESAGFADSRVSRQAVAAAHAALTALYPDAAPDASPSDLADAAEPAARLVRYMSNALISARIDAIRDCAQTVEAMRR